LLAEEEQDIALNGDGNTTARGQPILTTYGPKPDSLFTTEILFVKTKNSNNEDIIAYYHHDHLNTPIQATDKAGNIVWSANFNAFGRVTITTPAVTLEYPVITSNLRFPGQYEDSETRLYYNWNRYYSPDEGRYIMADPIGLEGGGNLYKYVEADPVNLIDPTGEFGIVGAGGGAAFSMGMQIGTCLLFGGDLFTCFKCINWVDVAISAVAGAVAPTLLKDVAGGLPKYRKAKRSLTALGGPALGGLATNQYKNTLIDYGKAATGSAVVKMVMPSYRIGCEDECERYRFDKGTMGVITSILN
jgi:RHS repeat-associated protein